MNDLLKKEIIELIYSHQERTFLGFSALQWSVVTPLLILFLTFFFQWLIRRRAKNRELKVKEQYIFIWVDEILKHVKEQIKFYNEFIAKIKELDNTNSHSCVMSITELHIDKVLAIPLNEALEIFSLKRKGDKISNLKKYKQLFVKLNDIKNFHNNSMKLYENWHANYKKYDLEWRDHYLKINDIYNNIVFAEKEKSSLLYKIGVILLNPQDKPIQTKRDFMENIVFPVIKLMIDNPIKTNEPDFILNIIKIFRNCNSSYDAIFFFNKELNEALTYNIAKMDDCIKDVENAVIDLKHTKIRF